MDKIVSYICYNQKN